MLDILLLAFGVAIPWVLGVSLLACVHALSGAPPRNPSSLPWLIGCGWFIGVFLMTLHLRLLAALGIPFGFVAAVMPLAFAAAALGWLAKQRGFPVDLRGALARLGGRDLLGWQRGAWIALLAWLIIRFVLLLAEVTWRPLYPWDAWTQWGTKARVWFELKTLVPFAQLPEWLGSAGVATYFDAAPHYPGTVPLWQVWSALMIGRWDDALINVSWWISAVAFGLALYGALRRLEFTRIVALTGAALVLSLPILNVHIALAGYADFPLACYLTLAALAMLGFARERRWTDGFLTIVFVIACVLIKNPGKAWVIVLLPGLAVALWPRRGLQWVAWTFAAALLLLLLLARTGVSVLGYQLTLQYAMPWGALFDAYFSFANWNLLWYAASATVVIAWKGLLSREVAPFTCIVAGGLMFLFLGFAFTSAGAWVEDQSTVNRATLHLAPMVVVWMLVALRALSATRTVVVPAKGVV